MTPTGHQGLPGTIRTNSRWAAHRSFGPTHASKTISARVMRGDRTSDRKFRLVLDDTQRRFSSHLSLRYEWHSQLLTLPTMAFNCDINVFGPFFPCLGDVPQAAGVSREPGISRQR